jgi:predicted O-methyltransferase YrrM
MATTHTPRTPAFDAYLESTFTAEDDFLRTLMTEAVADGIPAIAIAPEQTSFLQVLIRASGARNILEIGSLAGYSAITMARALPPGGTLTALELVPNYAQFIRRKVEQAGLATVVNVIEGPALASIAAFDPAARFDLVFIDADKPNYVNYLHAVLPLMNPGGLIIGDNAMAWGYVQEEHSDYEPENVAGIRAFNHALATHPAIQATLVPLGDGMAIGVVRP